jgi:hypothetical protein
VPTAIAHSRYWFFTIPQGCNRSKWQVLLCSSIDQGGGKRRGEVITQAFIQPQSCSAPVFDELPD